ncbi:MAG: hypothetical protein CL484_09975 [Acidobacteria bacterium]|nr:hypothetical protein [Acidobacteriota bacterium]
MKNILSDEFFDSYQKTQTSPIDSTSCGLPTIDRICRDSGGGRGFGRGWFITVAGNPGIGKSALALNFASACLSGTPEQPPEPCGIINLEMSPEQMSTRLYSLHTGTALRKLEHGGFSSLVWNITKEKLAGSPPLYVPDNLLTTWESCLEFAHECADAGVKWICLDYLQLATTGDEDTIYRTTQRIVTELRAFGVARDCTIICLSQFNRGTSSNYDSSPRSQGLFGGMILEASSDLCLLLDHSRFVRAGATQQLGRTYLLCTKNRHGACLEVPIEFDYSTLRISEANEYDERKWPK